MKQTHRDAMIGISLILNLLLAAALLYDYYRNDSRYALAVVGAYFVFTLVFLFMWAMDRRGHELDHVTYTVEHAPTPLPVRFEAIAPVTPLPAKAAEAEKPVEEAFPFTYQGYTLYSRAVDLKNGGRRTIWFFAKGRPRSGAPAAKPAGYHVGVNERTGLPFLKKGTGSDGEDLTPNVVQAYRPQCAALTEEGHQCRNSARHDSKYCISHFGYQPPAIAKAAANREDTLPHVKGAPDTKPSVRRPAST